MVKNYLKLMLAIVLTSQAMAQAIPSNVPKDGLVGWWPFNGNANDESGNGNHGTVNGATLTSDRNGKENSAYSFDDLKSYISILPSKTLSFGNEFSISIWFKRNGILNNDRIFSFEKAGSPDGYQFRFAIDVNTIDNNKLYFLGVSNNLNNSTGWSNNNGYTLKTNNTVISSNWNNVLLTRNNSTFSLYLNGYIQSTSQTSQIIDFLLNKNNITLGAVLLNNSYVDFFNGNLDDIAIYNRVLSEQEIKQLYEGCPRETATLNPTNGVVLKNSNPITLSATPSGGVFKGKAILNGDFTPKNATLGSNSFDYHFVNSQGCKDSTQFKVVVYDTLGTVCSSTDTLKIKFQLTTGIKAGQLTAMNVYPNPTSDVLIIEASDVNALKNYTYRIVNLEGKEVYKNFVTATKTEISLKLIGSKGIYVLHILDENGTSIENKKIVLE